MKLLVTFLFIAMLAGCATVKRIESLSNSTSSDITGAIALKPISAISHGKTIRFNIKKGLSPSIRRVNDGKDYYEIIELYGNADSNFNFTISSFCDCLGFRKWAVHPVATLYNANGEVIANESLTNNPMIKNINGKFPSDGNYKLIVVADNSKNGVQIGYAQAYAQGVPIFSLPITIHHEGLVQVQWNK